MTTREFYVAIANAESIITPSEIDGIDYEALTSKAAELITKLDEKNAKRASADSKEKKETAARREAVLSFLTARRGESFTRDEIAENTGITPTQATAACSALAKSELITKSNRKIDKAVKVVYSANEEEVN